MIAPDRRCHCHRGPGVASPGWPGGLGPADPRGGNRAGPEIAQHNGHSAPQWASGPRGRAGGRALGKITAEFKGALRGHALRTFMGDDAGKQPGSLQEVLLHETAVAWIRRRLACTVPVKCWEETRQEYSTRLKRCCASTTSTMWTPCAGPSPSVVRRWTTPRGVDLATRLRRFIMFY